MLSKSREAEIYYAIIRNGLSFGSNNETHHPKKRRIRRDAAFVAFVSDYFSTGYCSFVSAASSSPHRETMVLGICTFSMVASANTAASLP